MQSTVPGTYSCTEMRILYSYVRPYSIVILTQLLRYRILSTQMYVLPLCASRVRGVWSMGGVGTTVL
jgi:hypothetical protein